MRIVVQFLYDKGGGLIAYARHALILIGLGVLFLPAMALGQAQIPKIHTGVSPWALLSSNLHALGKSEQEVVSYRLMLSEEQSEVNPPFEAIGMRGADLHGRAFFPHAIRPLAPLWGSSTGASEPSTNASGFVVDRSGNLQHVLGDARSSLTVLEGNSNTFTITLGEPPSGEVTGIITGHENTDLAVNPTQLTFDDSNWNVEQTITVDVKQDTDDTDEEVKLTFTALGGGIKESIYIAVRILDTSPVSGNLSAEQLEVEEGERRKLTVMPLRPFTRSITGDVHVPLKFEKGTSEGGADHNAMRHTSIPQGVKSTTTEIQMRGDDTDDKRSTVAVDGSKLEEKIVVSGDQKEMAARSKDNNRPRVCLEVLPEIVTAGDWLTVKATVQPVQQNDIQVAIDFSFMARFFDSNVFDDPATNTTSITIPRRKAESAPLKFKTHWNNSEWATHLGYLLGTVPQETDHPLCLCPWFRVLAPPTLTLSASPNPVNEGSKVTLTATIKKARSKDITVWLDYPNSLTTDTASDPNDYTPLTAITIKARMRKGTGEIQTHEDVIVDDHETFTVAIDGTRLPPGEGPGSPSSVKVTIIDTNGPAIRFDSSTSSVDEDGGTHHVAVSLNPAPGSDITLNYNTLGGSATAGTDYTSSGTVFVPANATSVNIPVVIIDDNLDEDAETVILTLENGTGYHLSTPKKHTLTIDDNDMPVANFDSSTGSVSEDGGTHNVAVSISPAPWSDLILTYTVGGTATKNTDYNIKNSGTIFLNANATSVNIPVVITDDTVDENDETIILTLVSGLKYDLGSPNEHTLTITDNDTPEISFASVAGSVGEDAGTHHVEVAISPAPRAALTLNYTLGGTATRGTDYTSSGTVSVAANATSVDIPVVITDDNVDENDETVILTLTSGTGYTVGSPSEHTLTITDNDDMPAASFYRSRFSVPESRDFHYVRVSISPISTVPLTLTYTTGGTATENTDYRIAGSGTLSVPAYSDGGFIPVDIIDDGVDENDETVLLTLGSGTGYTVGSPGTFTLTIQDDDTPAVRFDSSTGSVDEDGGTHDVALSLSPVPGSDITLNYTLGGTATEDADYSITGSGTVSVAAGLTSVKIPVKITDDTVDESDETVTLTLTSGTGYTMGSPSEYTLTITDNDTRTVDFTSARGSVGEDGGLHHVAVAISSAPSVPFTLNYTLGGTAARDVDYISSGTVPVTAGLTSVNIPVEIIDDDVDDDAETIILTLASGTGYTVGSVNVHTLTITDNDGMPQVNFASAAGSVGEDGGTRDVEVSLSPAPGAAFTLNYTLGGTATEDADYSITGSGTISVSAGATSVNIPIVITDDTEDEPDETVILTLTDGTEYTVGSANVHTLTITDNDGMPQVSFALGASSVGEDAGTHHVAVAIISALAAPFTLNYTLGGTATEDADYSITGSGTISVSANASSVNIPIVITDDTEDEPDETVILTLTDGTEYTVGGANVHTLTITDNDGMPQVSFALGASSVGEDAGTHHVAVAIISALAAPFTLNYTLGGTATEDADYSITGSGTISVSAGATSVNIPIVITDDTEDEPDETVILTLTDGTEYTVGGANVHTLTITDNDGMPQVSFALGASSVGEDAGTHHVAVAIISALAAPFTLNYTLGGTATEDADYSITGSGTISVSAGATSVNIPIVITDDTEDEPDETVILTLTDGTEYTVGGANVHTLTITDNDGMPQVSFALGASSVGEDAGTHHVAVAISPAPTAPLTLSYILGGTATENADYSSSGTISVATGRTSVNIPIGITDDTEDESNETIRLTLASGTGYTVGSPGTHTLTIVDNDDAPDTPVTVSLSASPNLVDEGESVTITATLSEALPDAVTINLRDTPGEPPTEPSDYGSLPSITIAGGSRTGSGTLDIKDDGVAEKEERFTVDIIDELPSGVELGSPSSVEITITDDDSPPPVEVTLSAFPNPVEEGNSVTVTATLTRVLETDVEVPLVYNDETTHPPEPGDYTPLRGVTILRGETQGSGRIQTLTDADMDDETFIVALGDLPPALLVPGRESSQSVTIRDITSPTAVTVDLSASPNPVDEGGKITVTAMLSEAPDTDVVIPLILTDGTANAQDYQASIPVQVEIEAGKTSGTYPISTIQDDIAEGDETFTVALGALPSRLVAGDSRWIDITITDDDEAGMNTPQSVSVAEGGEKSFGISLTSEPLGEVEVMMTWPSGTDLTVHPITRTFGPDNWRTEQQVSLRAANDMDLMDDQVEVTLTASGSIDYTGISETISVTITDNDTPGIVAPVSVTMVEGSQRTLEITLAQMPSDLVTMTITGHAGTDLALNNAFLTFTPSNWSTAQTVTLTAAEDDDFVDDTETLTLTASGGGYAGVTTDITVTITDNDAPGLVAPEAVQMEEGRTHPLMVRLSASPSGPVTLTFTGHAGTDLTLDQTSLTFTSADWNTSKAVTLTAAEDDEDYADETVDLKVTASGGGYDGVTADITVTIMDNDERPGPLTITLYDEQALEHAEAIQLPIELSRPVDQVVTVQYASTDGTAEAGLDYMTSRGIVIFDPGATRGVIEIEVTDDELPEENETFMVTLSKPRNAIIARETGTGTILDDDGASAILRVEDALVLEEDGMVRFRVLLSHPQRQMISAAYRTRDGTAKAGEDYEASSGVVTLAPGTVEAMIAVPLLKDGLDWREETFTVHLESSKHAEIAKAVGVATIQESTTVSEEVLEAYAARFVRTSGVQVVEALGERFRSGADGASCGAADRAEMARLWYSASSWDPSLGELLAGCRMSATSYSGSFSVWGRGAFRQFNGRDDDALTLRGEVTTGMLGADYRWRGGWLAGLLLAHSQGEGSFEVVQQSGEITAGLTGVYPYVSYARAGWDVWMSAGAGRGQAEVLELKGDLVSRFGAMGVRGKLVSSGTIGLNYHGDVLVTDAEIKEHEVTAEVYRVRAGVEANVKISDGLRPFLEANVRSDGGSAETGVGLEFGGGIRVDYPAWHLQADLRTQGLVMHTADGFTEWGISGSVQVGRQSEGLMMRVRPSWGRGQGMSMYGQQTILDAVPLGADAQRTELELGYGIPWKDGTARSIVGVTQLHQRVMYRLGGELHPTEWLSFSVFGLAHGHATSLEDLGLNVRGSLRY